MAKLKYMAEEVYSISMIDYGYEVMAFIENNSLSHFRMYVIAPSELCRLVAERLHKINLEKEETYGN